MSENVVAYQTVDFSRLPTVDHRFDFRLQERAKRARSPEPNAKTSRPSRKGSSGDRRQVHPGEYAHPVGHSREYIEHRLENELASNDQKRDALNAERQMVLMNQTRVDPQVVRALRRYESAMNAIENEHNEIVAATNSMLFRSDVDEPRYRNTARPSSPVTFENPFRTI